MPEYVVEPLDPETAVPNPERRGLERLVNDLDGTVVRLGRHRDCGAARSGIVLAGRGGGRDAWPALAVPVPRARRGTRARRPRRTGIRAK